MFYFSMDMQCIEFQIHTENRAVVARVSGVEKMLTGTKVFAVVNEKCTEITEWR